MPRKGAPSILSPYGILPRWARLVLWIGLFASFTAAVAYNAAQTGIIDQIYRPETLVTDLPDGFAVNVGNHVGRVIGSSNSVCAGEPCKILKLNLTQDTPVNLLVNGQVYSETWQVKVLPEGLRLVRPDGSFVTAAN